MVTLRGVFPASTALAVHMGAARCYSGVSGQGASVISADGATLSFVTPPAPGGCTNIVVSDSSDFAVTTVDVAERPFYDTVYRTRRNFPPWYGLGARMVEFEPPQALDREAVMASDPIWNYMGTTKPSGVAADVMFNYQFDGSASQLLDRGPNGYDLTVDAGKVFTVRGPGSIIGVGFDDVLRLVHPGAAGAAIATLAQLGPLTIEAVILRSITSGSPDNIIGYGGDPSVGDGTTNRAWHCYLAATYANPGFLHEAGLGVDDDVVFQHATYNAPAIVPDGLIQHIAWIRDDSDPPNISFAQNGKIVAGPVAMNALPGGSMSAVQMFIGRETGGGAGTDRFTGAMYSLRGWPVELTEAQLTENYKRIRGLID